MKSVIEYIAEGCLGGATVREEEEVVHLSVALRAHFRRPLYTGYFLLVEFLRDFYLHPGAFLGSS